MLFNKYQYDPDNMVKRGYSHSVDAKNDEGHHFWIKWILGIDKADTKGKILSDKLRDLQKARNNSLPKIIEYGFDDEQKAFAIVFEFLEEVKTFENCFDDFKTQNILGGLTEITSCLQELHTKYKINHGDINPGNIMVNKNGHFFLIDFGLTDITRTLSQEAGLEIFAGKFAAPEKLNNLITKGFPYQSDIYSLGKVIEWYLDVKQLEITEEQTLTFRKILSEKPSDRPAWPYILDFLKNLTSSFDMESIQIGFQKKSFSPEFLGLLNSTEPVFIISPTPGSNYLVDIIIGNFICEGALWLKKEQKLLFNTISLTKDFPFWKLEQKRKEGKKLPGKYSYKTEKTPDTVNLSPIFEQWFEQKEKQQTYREKRRVIHEELGFYRELLEYEKKVIAENALRLRYSSFSLEENEISFSIVQDEKLSSEGFIQRHIDEGNDVSSEGIEYFISANASRKQTKENVGFTGKPYDFIFQDQLLKIKDCEGLDSRKIPHSGYLFENTNKMEEEKNRQLEAIRKVGKNEVLNPDLIYYLFNPDQLPAVQSDFIELETVFQKDKNGGSLTYSYNQQKAIQKALNNTPFTVIQGPPGTGKTTVITEIVFQILFKKPEAKILITSQTNNAVDQVLENLLKNKIPVLRLSGITSPKNPEIGKQTLGRKLEGWKVQVRQQAEKNFEKVKTKFWEDLLSKHVLATFVAEILFEKIDWKKKKSKIESRLSNFKELKNLHSLPPEEEKAIEKIDIELKTEIAAFIKIQSLHRDWIATLASLEENGALNQKLIDSIRVIGATCNHIASKKYSRYHFEFDYVIMDESSKATTAEALVPIITGKNLIFVGDHRQLKPMLTKKYEVENWLRDKFKVEADELENWDDYFNRPSLFETIINRVDSNFKTQLTECRRSSEDQVKLTSDCFYVPEGDEPIEYVPRSPENEHNLPLSIKSSILFIDIGSHYKSELDSTKNRSSKNEESAKLIPDILNYLDKYPKVREYSIGVITGYSAQFHLLNSKINKMIQKQGLKNIRRRTNSEEKFTVSVIDRFQGLERDIIILDLVKSGVGLHLGFLEVPNRINVALSRQKKLLIIVGDYTSIVNAKTSSRLNKEKAALQKYLVGINPEWIVKAENLKELFV